MQTAQNFLSSLEAFVEVIKSEEDSTRIELMGLKLKTIKA